MVTPLEALNRLKYGLEQSGELPDSVTYIVQEADFDGTNANLKLPVIQLTPVTSARITDFNTDQVSVVEDDNGNAIGRRFHAEYQMTIQIDVLTVDGRTRDDESIQSLSDSIRRALYQYDSAGIDNPVPDKNGKATDSIWRFVSNQGQRADDESMNPTLRRWRQDVDLWSYEEFTTTEDYIVSVNIPEDGDMNDTDADGQISNT